MLWPPAYLADNHESGVDAQTRGQTDAVGLRQALAEVRKCGQHLQSGVDGTLGIVFMGLGIAKIDQQTIAKILGNMATIALDHLGAGGLIGHRDLAEVFRIKLISERCRANQVAEEDGELTALGRRPRLSGWSRRLQPHLRCTGWLGRRERRYLR